MDPTARGERAQLRLIQGLHGQNFGQTIPPHTPKLESAYRVKNMLGFFFFSHKDLICSCQVLEEQAKPQR